MSPRTEPGEFVIVGAGGVGREAYDAAVSSRVVDGLLGYLDDSVDPRAAARLQADVLGPIDTPLGPDVSLVIAIGDGAARRSIASRIEARLGPARVAWATIVDASVTIGGNCIIGGGVLLLPGARISNAVTLGHHVQVHTNGVVGHDSILADHVSVFPGATIGGSVRIGDAATIGSGATVLP
ncbi:MAG: hypothetical protein ABJ382_06320, partial [Ilumatobacter sp.]